MDEHSTALTMMVKVQATNNASFTLRICTGWMDHRRMKLTNSKSAVFKKSHRNGIPLGQSMCCNNRGQAKQGVA